MRLFSKKQGDQPFTGGLAGEVAGTWSVYQARVASWLNERTRRYSSRRWLALLVCFCLVAGGTCIYLIISSIY